MDIFGRELETGINYVGNHYHNILSRRNTYYYVTENSPMEGTPDALEMKLYDHQDASLTVMKKMEAIKCIEEKGFEIHTECGVLSNALGSGKSAIIIALCASDTVPKNTPVRYNIPRSGHYAANGKTSSVTIHRTFASYIDINLIFVGDSVLTQWGDEIKRFAPSLKVYIISNKATLLKFYNNIFNKTLEKYDIILIKNKTISGKWVWKYGENPYDMTIKTKTKHIFNMIGHMFRNKMVKRIFVDDFDSIGLPSKSPKIATRMTWLVSCTRKFATGRSNITINADGVSLTDAIQYKNNIVYYDMLMDDSIYTLFNVCVKSDFVNRSSSAGIVRCLYNLFDVDDQGIVDLITLMPGTHIDKIREAINGSDYEAAAQEAGTVVSSASGILQILMKENFDKLIIATRVINFIEEELTQDDLEMLPPIPKNVDDDTDFKYSVYNLRTTTLPEYTYPGLKTLVSKEYDRQFVIREETTKCLDRLKHNLMTNECLVCKISLKENKEEEEDDDDFDDELGMLLSSDDENDTKEGYCILPCCSKIIHADCAIRSCNFKTVTKPGGVNLIGTCPFVRSHEFLYTDLCYITRDFDIQDLASDDIIITSEEELKDEKKTYTPEEGPIVNNKPKITDKLSAAIELAMGHSLIDEKGFDPNSKSILIGDTKLPPSPYISVIRDFKLNNINISNKLLWTILRFLSPDLVPRIVFFSNFKKQLNNLGDKFREAGMSYEILEGTQSKKNIKIANFKSGKLHALGIQGTKHCSGINLPEAHVACFLHVPENKSIAKQLMGRIIRNGRTYNPVVRFLINQNEMEKLNRFMA